MPTLKVDGPIQVHFTPYALARSAYHLLQMSRAYAGPKDADVARHYLYCVSIELGLKAALLARDISTANKARLKRFGLNLIPLSEELARVYAGSPFSPDDHEAIAMIDPFFSTKGLEYFTPPMLEAVANGYSSLPPIERMEHAAGNVVDFLSERRFFVDAPNDTHPYARGGSPAVPGT